MKTFGSLERNGRHVTLVTLRLVAAALFLCGTTAAGQAGKPRARDLGVPFEGEPGPFNAITDVAGIEVGEATLVSGEGAHAVRTGVTVVLPRGKTWQPVFAGTYAGNGFGDLTGTHWVEEGGVLGGPIAITNTRSVGTVRDAILRWFETELRVEIDWHQPVVGETSDATLNDSAGFHVREEHVFLALNGARPGPVPEGNVGGGTGMICHGFKGGTGTASRLVSAAGATYTLGVLVQANHGSRQRLTIAGVPVGSELENDGPEAVAPDVDVEAGLREGSIIVVVATDAPLLPHQLERLARRVPMGIARVGGTASNGSGDIFIAFSTANPGAARSGGGPVELTMLPNETISPFFAATIEAVEESIVNALVAAETMTGKNGRRVEALPHGRLREILRRYNRLEN